jgi:alpha-galactosidase
VWRVKNPDSTYTVALFNLGAAPAKVSVSWSDLGISGAATVRDLWQHSDLGKFDADYSVDLPTHASRLLHVSPAR